jgi:hypothetical protein
VLQKERIKIRRRNGAKTISHQEEFEDTDCNETSQE